jgi:hypothetical protein
MRGKSEFEIPIARANHLIAALCFLSQFLLVGACSHRDADRENASYYYTKGVQQYARKGYQASLDNFLKAAAIAPDNARFLFSVARSYAVLGKTGEAIAWLEKTIALGSHFNLDKDAAFDGIRGLPAYQSILKRIQLLDRPVNSSSVAFRIPEKDLMPECITYDPTKKIFYVGSTYKRKVISIDSNGTIRDFISEGQDGLWSVFGIRVDSARRVLWVLSSVYRGMKGFDAGQFGMSAVYMFNLENGNCIRRYLLDERPKHHNLNDLVINGSGDVFITDDQANCVYWISHQTQKLELFVKLAKCTFPNGICLSGDQQYLYLSHAEGASVVDLRTRVVQSLSHKSNISLCGLDGLYCYRDSLIGIQTYEPQRILQFELAKNQIEVDRIGVVEANNPLFELPTTGVIADDSLYYIANSQLLKFGEDGTIYPFGKLNEIVILKAKLPAIRSVQ